MGRACAIAAIILALAACGPPPRPVVTEDGEVISVPAARPAPQTSVGVSVGTGGSAVGVRGRNVGVAAGSGGRRSVGIWF